MERKNAWTTYSVSDVEHLESTAKAYKDFLDKGKTERECIDQIVNRIEKEGYVELEELIKEKKTLQKFVMRAGISAM